MGGHDIAVAGFSNRDSLDVAEILKLVDEACILPRTHLAHDLATGDRGNQRIGDLSLWNPASCEIGGMPLTDMLQSGFGATGLEEYNPSIGGAPDADDALGGVLYSASCKFLKQFPTVNAYPPSTLAGRGAVTDRG
jgi:hypothetical protein